MVAALERKRKVAVIVGDNAYDNYGDSASFIASHMTDWIEVTQEEHVALQYWCHKQYAGSYRLIEDVTRSVDIKEIMKLARAEQAKREKAEEERKAKSLAKKAAKKKLAEDEKRRLYEQLKKELGHE